MKKIALDEEEKNIVDSYERGEWKSVKSPKQEMKRLREYARNTLQKDKRINIRMSSNEGGGPCLRCGGSHSIAYCPSGIELAKRVIKRLGWK